MRPWTPRSCHATTIHGACRWLASYWRDGHPVCGIHKRAKRIEYHAPAVLG